MQFKVSINYSINSNIKLDLQLDTNINGISIIFGKSGAGKTTMLNLISGLIKSDADEDSIKFNKVYWQKNNSKIFQTTRQRKIGYVFQDNLLFPHLSVQENLRFAEDNRQNLDKNTKEKILQSLALDKQLLSNMPETLSAGEKNRVAIARTLFSNPDLILMDEPLANLDTGIKEKIIHVLKELQKELEIPIFYVTHSIEEAKLLGDRFWVLEQGKIQQYHNTKTWLSAINKQWNMRNTIGNDANNGERHIIQSRNFDEYNTSSLLAASLTNIFQGKLLKFDFENNLLEILCSNSKDGLEDKTFKDKELKDIEAIKDNENIDSNKNLGINHEVSYILKNKDLDIEYDSKFTSYLLLKLENPFDFNLKELSQDSVADKFESSIEDISFDGGYKLDRIKLLSKANENLPLNNMLYNPAKIYLEADDILVSSMPLEHTNLLNCYQAKIKNIYYQNTDYILQLAIINDNGIEFVHTVNCLLNSYSLEKLGIMVGNANLYSALEQELQFENSTGDSSEYHKINKINGNLLKIYELQDYYIGFSKLRIV